MDPVILPIIMALLAAGGGAMSAMGKSNPERTKQLPRFTGQGQDALSQLLSQGMQNADFGGMENRARNMFQTQTMPSIAERFTSMGGEGGQRSSAFAPAAMGAGADLESQLAALKGRFGMQQLGMGLTPQFENIFIPKSPGRMQQFGSSMMGAGMGGLPGSMKLASQQIDSGQNSEILDLLRNIFNSSGGGQGVNSTGFEGVRSLGQMGSPISSWKGF
jgi:hypothetical protein